ncbi:MAG: LmeA family phospholipid-binding protein [Armatimonadaceae bacterium]
MKAQAVLRSHVVLACIAGLVTAMSTGCRRPVEKTAERIIKERLPIVLGAAKSYEVNVESASMGAGMRGRLRHVSVFGRGVALTNGMILDRVLIEASDVSVDRKSAVIDGVRSSTMDAWLDAREVEAIIRKRRPDLPPVNLTVVGETLQVRTVPRVLGFPTITVAIDGSLVVAKSGRELHFQPKTARLGVVPIPDSVVGYVADIVNPVAEMMAFPVPMLARNVSLDGGFIRIGAELTVEELLPILNKR